MRRKIVSSIRDIQEQKEREEKQLRKNSTDVITGLYCFSAGIKYIQECRASHFFHPNRKFITVKTHGCDPPAILFLKFPAAAFRQTAQLLQDHITKYNAIFLICLFPGIPGAQSVWQGSRLPGADDVDYLQGRQILSGGRSVDLHIA